MSYCKHIKKFYSKHIRGEPSVFWMFDESILPTGSRTGSRIEDGGHPKDKCHRNITNASDDDLGDIITSVPLQKISICENNIDRPLTQADVASFPRLP
jgi:hypothetical protein